MTKYNPPVHIHHTTTQYWIFRSFLLLIAMINLTHEMPHASKVMERISFHKHETLAGLAVDLVQKPSRMHLYGSNIYSLLYSQ